MRPFSYQRAADAAGAVATFSRERRRVMYLGGGTNLVDLMRLGVATPELLIDVARLPYDRVEALPDGGVRVGAAVRNSELAADPTVRRDFPVLAQALLAGASGQLRNLATVGGNLLQRTRCGYFQDVSKPCNKRLPGSGCPARDGEHRNLAILGHSPACVATHPSDMAVALTALGASVEVQGLAGRRLIPMPGLHRLPGAEPDRDTVLEPGDLITAVEVPALAYGAGSGYRKVRERASFAFAVVSVAAALDVADGRVVDCRLALGGVAHAPWRAERAEAELRGAPAGEESFRRAADAELAAAEPLRDNAYKVPLARNVLVRTLTDLLAGADRTTGGDA
jgi:xanthine dehydrogenase YagS FAD-binding subunit